MDDRQLNPKPCGLNGFRTKSYGNTMHSATSKWDKDMSENLARKLVTSYHTPPLYMDKNQKYTHGPNDG